MPPACQVQARAYYTPIRHCWEALAQIRPYRKGKSLSIKVAMPSLCSIASSCWAVNRSTCSLFLARRLWVSCCLSCLFCISAFFPFPVTFLNFFSSLFFSLFLSSFLFSFFLFFSFLSSLFFFLLSFLSFFFFCFFF